jgi:hypothetical protein
LRSEITLHWECLNRTEKLEVLEQCAKFEADPEQRYFNPDLPVARRRGATNQWLSDRFHTMPPSEREFLFVNLSIRAQKILEKIAFKGSDTNNFSKSDSLEYY